MMEPILKVDGASIRFGGVIAADNVSFELAKGEIKGLIGPNGAGKSTLMNLISGIYDLDEGRIFLDGVDVSKVPAYKRARMGIGRTFQTPRFLQRATIRDNLLLGIDLADQMGYIKSFLGKKGFDFDEELNVLMDLAGFKVDWDDDISAIPFGQQKILEVIRAILSHPKVILIDEPAAGLNPSELENSMALMRYAATELGAGITVIEHRMDLIMNFCKDIVVLNFGKVIAQGSPAEISSNQAVIEAYLGRETTH